MCLVESLNGNDKYSTEGTVTNNGSSYIILFYFIFHVFVYCTKCKRHCINEKKKVGRAFEYFFCFFASCKLVCSFIFVFIIHQSALIFKAQFQGRKANDKCIKVELWTCSKSRYLWPQVSQVLFGTQFPGSFHRSQLSR